MDSSTREIWPSRLKEKRRDFRRFLFSKLLKIKHLWRRRELNYSTH